VAVGAAFCRQCGEAYSLNYILAKDEAPQEEVQEVEAALLNPPSGAGVEEFPEGFRVWASTRSCIALFLVPFTVVWAGGSLGGIYGSQIVNGEFNLIMSLFGLPFAAGSAMLVLFTLMSVWGRMEIRVEGDEGQVFTGISDVGRRKRFRWSEFTGVRRESHRDSDGDRQLRLVLEGPQRLEFGQGLSEARQLFMLAVLRGKLKARR
jgi:hypothetical protein